MSQIDDSVSAAGQAFEFYRAMLFAFERNAGSLKDLSGLIGDTGMQDLLLREFLGGPWNQGTNKGTEPHMMIPRDAGGDWATLVAHYADYVKVRRNYPDFGVTYPNLHQAWCVRLAAQGRQWGYKLEQVPQARWTDIQAWMERNGEKLAIKRELLQYVAEQRANLGVGYRILALGSIVRADPSGGKGCDLFPVVNLSSSKDPDMSWLGVGDEGQSNIFGPKTFVLMRV